MQYNPEEFSEILNIFKVESEEIIEELNDGFLMLEKDPDDKTPLKKLFQLAHSLKGAARMIGFNSIQDLSHKLEDVFSYWKKDNVKIDNSSFQIFYDICDLLNEVISKAVNAQSDVYSEKVMIAMNSLDNFIAEKNGITEQKQEENFENLIKKRSTDINALMLELMFVLERDNKSDNNEEVLIVIVEILGHVYDLFEDTNFYNIKSGIKNIVENINDSSVDKDKLLSLTREKIIVLRNEIYAVYKELNITPDLKRQEKSLSDQQENVVALNDIKQIQDKYDNLLKNLAKIKVDKSYIDIVINEIEYIVEKSNVENVRLLLSRILTILSNIKNQNILVENDCYMVILQCLYYAKNIINDDKNSNTNNLNFLIQRLDVISDMINIADFKDVRITDESKTVNAHNKNYMNNIQNSFHGFELNEIKTLRVDTAKLDNLISQIGELLVNGIKNREHLSNLAEINEKLVKWSNSGKKISNYIKYAERKGLFESKEDENLVLFSKKIQEFLRENNNVINELQNDFIKLYNIISEDDNKLHHTAMEIDTIAKGIRVLPLASIFHSFPRMIRDIATENNKKVDFIIEGSDTTVDKKLIEEIKMPLIHILRNAVYHGIEEPQERVLSDKSETGLIKLSAKQIENNVLITIEDDGYGINIDKVKQTAIEKGLLSKEEAKNMKNEQLMKLLFLPGFSTADSINEISGRGIGLDVVKTKINNLNGDIFIDSILNKGCRVTIKLPVSMSTLKTFIVNVDEQKYAVPVNFVKIVKRINKDSIINKNGQDCIIHNNHSVPLYFLSEILNNNSATRKEDSLTIIIIENQETQAAFAVDKLIGDQEVIHKKLVPPLVKIKNISGFTTLATGEICLIINPYELFLNTVSGKFISKTEIKQLTDEN